MTISEFWKQEVDAGRSTLGLRARFKALKRAQAEERNARTLPRRRRRVRQARKAA